MTHGWAIGLTLIAALAWAAPAAASVTPAPAQSIASGLSAVTLGGLSVARDGTGGLVYTAGAGPAAHVYLSRLTGGTFSAPEQLDSGLPGGSGEVTVAAGNGGVLLIAFVNAGTIYVTEVTGTGAALTPLQNVGTGPGNPSLSLNNFGVGYLAFTATDGSGDDVDVDYWNGTTWLAASPAYVNSTPADNAGTGTGAPSVIAAGDGVGLVAWGENGHVFARRVWGTQPSTEVSQLDPAGLNGWAESSADQPEIAAGGDSSYPDIVFRERLVNGSQSQDRVLVTRMIAENVEPSAAVDSLATPGTESAGNPEIAMNEYGRGFAVAATASTHRVIVTPLSTNGGVGQSSAVDGSGEAGNPFPEPGLAGLTSTDVVWQSSSSGIDGSPTQIEMRYAQDGTDLGSPMVLSSSSAGPTDASDGLLASGDTDGDAVAAWVQGAGPLSVDVAQLYQSPGAPGVTARTLYTNTSTPTLSWTAAREAWGPLNYTVTLDGTAIAPTQNLSVPAPTPLIDGPHAFSVRAVNPAGQTSNSGIAHLFVDTYPPRLRIRLTGRMRSGVAVRLKVAAADTPNPTETGAAASGVASVIVAWGDRSRSQRVSPNASLRHVFRRRGIYRLTVTATDRAGNATSLSRYLRIIR